MDPAEIRNFYYYKSHALTFGGMCRARILQDKIPRMVSYSRPSILKLKKKILVIFYGVMLAQMSPTFVYNF